jgi:hypothetical protein
LIKTIMDVTAAILIAAAIGLNASRNALPPL